MTALVPLVLWIAVACSAAGTPPPGPAAPAHPIATATAPAGSVATGPYSTLQAAERFVRTEAEPQSPLTPISPSDTWRPSARLHVIHATFQGGASYAGDWYFFFAQGNLVGRQYFTRSMSLLILDESAVAVRYDVYLQGDPHCCPSGGSAIVRFRWDGTGLAALDPIYGVQT